MLRRLLGNSLHCRLDPRLHLGVQGDHHRQGWKVRLLVRRPVWAQWGQVQVARRHP